MCVSASLAGAYSFNTNAFIAENRIVARTTLNAGLASSESPVAETAGAWVGADQFSAHCLRWSSAAPPGIVALAAPLPGASMGITITHQFGGDFGGLTGM